MAVKAVGIPGGGVTTSQSPPFTLPIRYMILGVFGFGLFALDMMVQSFHLGMAEAFTPGVVALTHLLTLGSLLSFVMGAVYQLSTVAFLIPISVVRLARWNFWVYGASIVGLIGSMASWWTSGMAVFGIVATISIYLYAIIIMASVARTKVQGAMKGFILSAHAYLILAVTAAWLMILAFTVPSELSQVSAELLVTHIVLAVGGFFTFLIIGFSFKLLPMFTLSHGYATWRQKWTLAAAHIALWCFILGTWSHVSLLYWIGALVGILAFVSQWFDIRGILAKRLRRKMEIPMKAVVTAAIFGLVSMCLVFVQLGVKGGLAVWQTVVTFYLLGWITLTVMGYAYKIVPFLIWSQRYSKTAGKGKTPLIADLIQLSKATPVLVGYATGLLLVCISTLCQWQAGAFVGSIVVAAAIFAFCYQLMQVMDPKALRKEMIEHD